MIMRKTIRDLSETPIKLLREGKENIFKKALFAAADKYRDLIQLPRPDNDQDKPEDDAQSAGGASTVTYGDSRVRSAFHDSGGDELEEEPEEEEAEEEEVEGGEAEGEEDESVEMSSRQDKDCKKNGKKNKTETYQEKLDNIFDEVRRGLGKRLVYLRNARCERAIEKLIIEAKDILAVRDLAKRLYKNRSLAFKNEVVTLDAPYSRHAATPQDMIRGRLPYDIGKIPETAEEIQQGEELVENFYMKFMHMDKVSALRETDKLAATLTGNQAILSQAGIRVHVGKYDPLKDEYKSRTGKNLYQTAMIAILGHLIKDDLPPSVLSMVKEAGKAYSLFAGIENWLSIWIDEAQNRNAKNGNDSNSFRGLNEGMVLGWIKGSENPSFCYRVEHGKEATYQLKLQNINVSSNKFQIQHNPGVFSKLEVTYYPACGFYTQAEVDEYIAKDPDNNKAFLIDPSMTDKIKEEAINLVPYLIHRARKLIEDPTCAHPRSEAIEKATKEFAERAMKLTEGKGFTNRESADKKLKEFCDHELMFCKNFPSSNMTDKEDDAHISDTLAAYQATKKCACPKATFACHFKVLQFSEMLKAHNEELFKFYVKKANQVKQLVHGIQRVYGLEEKDIEKTNRYKNNAIFGLCIACDKNAEDDDGSGDKGAASSRDPATPKKRAKADSVEHGRKQKRLK